MIKTTASHLTMMDSRRHLRQNYLPLVYANPFCDPCGLHQRPAHIATKEATQQMQSS